MPWIWQRSTSALSCPGPDRMSSSARPGRCFAAFVGKEALAPMLKDEIARAQRQGRKDMPTSMSDARALLNEVRQRGVARVVDTLLPGIVAFCAPVFDADGHIALGIVALGPTGTFDASWGGAVDKPLRAVAKQLSSDLGYLGD